MLTAVGTYTGDGVDDRAITGIGFQPDFVLVKGGANEAVVRTSTMDAGESKQLATGAACAANMVQALDSDGFTVGTDARVNANGTVYYYLAMRDNGDADFDVGNYTGNATDNRSISGVGFQPTVVMVMADSTAQACWNLSGGDSTYNTANTSADRVQAFEADGFQVGAGTSCNANSVVNHYVAWKNVTGESHSTSYTGNGADNHSLTGVGFQPDFMFIQKYSGTFQVACTRFVDNSGDESALVNASAFTTDIIQAFESDGFQVGTAVNANTNAQTYRYLALKEVADAPPAGGTTPRLTLLGVG